MRPFLMITLMSIPSRVASRIMVAPLWVTRAVGSVATSEMYSMILSSLQLAGNSDFPEFPVPGRWPPPVWSPSRMCVRPFGSERSTELHMKPLAKLPTAPPIDPPARDNAVDPTEAPARKPAAVPATGITEPPIALAPPPPAPPTYAPTPTPTTVPPSVSPAAQFGF